MIYNVSEIGSKLFSSFV